MEAGGLPIASRRAANCQPTGRQMEADGPPDGSRCQMPQI